ncbi:putative alkaline phosphatase [Basidiobolus meristosporus CBS 931.73]|uniref:Putative alkaline phosphatase n=1 Tax=Basidiobolus meristosporus CBS 931.73 TaxID=1314790 RepID=A0A1Y1Y3T3_9FUNG|nr:putative alkaline phosphatase [Basidiobolus meristosporus CBS 931.73]|eukprot:ORX92670.1 putative alkaline phosphatase [Basidiobolus meristosporus CBS 931.73]
MIFKAFAHIIPLSLGASVVTGTLYDGLNDNINYRSPFENLVEHGHSLDRIHGILSKRSALGNPSFAFTHNVASGDPYHDSVILWTRAEPVEEKLGSVCVKYLVSKDEDFKTIVARGKAITTADVDWTVKVEARGLKPLTNYYYKFHSCYDKKAESPVGRTKTMPRPDQKIDKSLRFAVYSCSNYPFGYFNAYGIPARTDSMDYIIHLGDYIYEYAGNGDYGDGAKIGRIPKPEKVITSLDDYRLRYATYRADPDLALAHQKFPWIVIWDDHEVADNTWKKGSANQNDTLLGVWFDKRKSSAEQAYFEWMPIRQVNRNDQRQIFRTFQIGDMADLIMLDTRNYERDITDMYYNTKWIEAIAEDPTRSLMGHHQEQWFYRELYKSKRRNAHWRLIGQQVEFNRLDYSAAIAGKIMNSDAWDGYRAARWRFFDFIKNHDIQNNIVLAGDVHSNWAWDLVDERNFKKYDIKTGEGAWGAAFTGTAVTSPSPYRSQNSTTRGKLEKTLVASNPALKWVESTYRGYYTLTLDYDAIQAVYWGVEEITTRNDKQIQLAQFKINHGENHLSRPFNVTAGGVEN